MTPSDPEKQTRSASRIDSFRHALAGWGTLIRGTPNARIHLAFALGATAAGLWLRLTRVEWAILAVTIGLVFTAEFINSALEAVVDLASPEIHPLAKSAKDIAAGGVLFAACVAVMVGLLLFGPPLLVLIFPGLRSLLY
jgi:diacylglycerol kinase